MIEMSSHDAHPESRRDRDLVFNAETCRVLRRKARSWESVTALVLALALIPLSVIGLVFPSPSVRKILGIAYFLAVVAAVLWFVLPPREVLDKLKREAIWIIAQKVGFEDRLPHESEYRPTDTDDDEPEPFARPALALGRSAMDWFSILIPPLAALCFGITQDPPVGVVLLLAAFGPLLFWETRQSNTYPPEDPPHER